MQGYMLTSLERFDPARDALEACAAHARASGSKQVIATAWLDMGNLERAVENWEAARHAYDVCLETYENVTAAGRKWARMNSGLVALATGDFEEAHTILDGLERDLDPNQITRYGWFGQLQFALAACVGRFGDREAFDAYVELGSGIEEHERFDRDVAWSAERAAEAAELQGWEEAARRCREIAERQYAGLS